MFFTGNIRQCEFLPWRNFARANFLSDKNSAKRNLAKITAKFRLTPRKFASALTKFRRIFGRTKNEKYRISFAFLLHSTVKYENERRAIRPGRISNNVYTQEKKMIGAFYSAQTLGNSGRNSNGKDHFG